MDSRLLCPWDSPGKSTAVGAFLRRIFPTQGSNLHLLGLAALAGGVFTSSVTWEARESLANLFEKGLLQAQTASPVSGSERGSFGSESVQDLGSLISW